MDEPKPYIERVLGALYYFAHKQEFVSKEELMQWITPKITDYQLYAAISNFKNKRMDLLKRTSIGKFRLNKDRIVIVYDEFLDGKIKLWVNCKKRIDDEKEVETLIEAQGSPIEPEVSPLTEDMEAIDAANVGAAILAYIRKLQKQHDKTDLGKLRATNEDQAQTIINLRNKVISLEGQLLKVQKMHEAQNQKIIDLNHCLKVEMKKNEDIKALKSPTASFKVSDVARITKLVKGI